MKQSFETTERISMDNLILTPMRVIVSGRWYDLDVLDTLALLKLDRF
jgi:hypothetical protein